MDAKIVREPTQAELDAMVKAAFPAWDSYQTTILKGGLFNTTYLLEHDGSRYILRVGPVRRELLLPYEHYLMDAEAWAYEKIAAAGIPTSTVTYIDTTKTLLDRDFMIVEYIPSTGMNTGSYSEEEKHTLYKTVGQYTRRMADITGEKFGRVGHILHGGGCASWSEYIRTELTEWADSIRRNTVDYYTEEELCTIVGMADTFREILDEVKTPCFNHCDLWTLNVLVPQEGQAESRAEVLAIIDPDRCCMGDPDYELASGWMMNDAFYEGYGRRIAEDDPHTKIRAEIYRMMFCILNGYFMWTQYDDKKPSFGDKERGLHHLTKVLKYRDIPS